MNEVKRIVAVAVGPQRDDMIGFNGVPSYVRPYIHGLIEGLGARGREVGRDYEIDYKERSQAKLAAAKRSELFRVTDHKEYDLIFAMSTNVVHAARDSGETTPIVGVVSAPRDEHFSRARNFTGISARRSQTAGQCLEYFLATVPTLKRVRVLHKPGYGPSDRSLTLVRMTAKKRGLTVQVITINNRSDIEKKLRVLPKRDLAKPPELGVLLLPIDVVLGASQMIIDLAQREKNLPTFSPITDFVTSDLTSALGGYGVPQHTCGILMAYYVDQIIWHSAEPKSLKFTDAGIDDFKWAISREAARTLNIRLPDVI
jgi:ABC-type uncharacterized transport system substrate-binding protein